jgi:hypothetical protein
MPKIALLLIALSTAFNLPAQETQNCNNLKLKTATDARDAEPCIAKLCDYVLSKTLHDGGNALNDARKTIFLWMDKTRDYNFTLNTQITKMCKGDNELLLGIYTTSMAKAALTTKGDFNKEAIRLMVEYMKDTRNGVSKTATTDKLVKAYDSNDVNKYID